jgi:TldD protein
MKELIDPDFLEKIILSLENKVDYVDMRINESQNTSITMKDGKIQEIKSGSDVGGSVRILKDGAWGFVFSNQISNLDRMAESALKIAKSLESDVKLADTESKIDHVETNAKIKPVDVSIDEKKEIISEADHAANLKNIVSTSVNYVDGEGKSIFVNSEGTYLNVEEVRVAMFLNAVAASNGVIQFGHRSLGGSGGFEVLKNEDIEKFGRTAASRALRLLKANSPPSGNFPVLMDCELTGVFIHEALGHAAEADLILQNDSILKGKMGSKIGSEHVNIIDDASMDAFGYYPYDAEGIKTGENILVRNGILESIISSRESASKLGIRPSGNARSSVSDQPIVRMSNTYLKSGDLKFDELLEDLKHGIYLKGSRGGQVDTGKGIFQFNAAEAFTIENGEIKNTLRDVSLSGHIMEILKKIKGVGSDFKMSVGFCGKAGQTVPVGDGGPHILVSEATVGGML